MAVDKLFGSCQAHNGGILPSSFSYQLDSQQLAELAQVMQRLVLSGYTWRHVYTQCVVANLLSAYRHGAVFGTDMSVCNTNNKRKYVTSGTYPEIEELASLLESLGYGKVDGLRTISRDLSTYIRNQQMRWNSSAVAPQDSVGSSYPGSRNDNNFNFASPTATVPASLDLQLRSREFERFVKSLSAEDIQALKEFLLENTKRDDNSILKNGNCM